MSSSRGRLSSGSEKEDKEGGRTDDNNSTGIDASLLEKRLESLRDTQESVQGLSIWCQANKKHSTAIIDTWLKVLRKSPVEKRLTMFYLANDIVQHAKRKGDGTVVNQWAVAVQKATPHVRTPSSISNAISRIFKIWEERGIYSKDAVADLLSLLSKHTVSGKEKGEKPSRKPETYTAGQDKVSAFQPNSLISKAKQAFRLKSHLGVTFRTKQFFNMNMEQLISSIKDRQHGMEVVEEITSLLEQCRGSEAKLLNEVDERRKIVETAEVGIVYYENVRSEARIVNSAYKTFTTRVFCTKDKVDERMRAFDEMERMASPPPSPPSPDNDTSMSMSMSIPTQIQQQQQSQSAVGSNNNFLSFDIINSLDMSTLQSIKIPPNKNSPHSEHRDYAQIEKPPEDVPWTNPQHTTPGGPQAIKSLVTSSASASTPDPQGGYTSVSSMAGMSDSSLQQLAQAQLTPDPMTSGWPPWSGDNSYQQQHYLPRSGQGQGQGQNYTTTTGSGSGMTPSMQLQMQMHMQQQQHNFGGFPPPIPDIGSIPLPPGPPAPNPPLPTGTTTTDSKNPPPINFPPYGMGLPPPDWNNTGDHQEGYDYEEYKPQGQGQGHYTPNSQQQPRYHPYNQNQNTPGGNWPKGRNMNMNNPNHIPVTRSPNPGYSPRNPMTPTGSSPPPRFSGPPPPQHGYNQTPPLTPNKTEKLLAPQYLQTHLAMAESSVASESQAVEYGYNTNAGSYDETNTGSTAGSEGQGMNGNEEESYDPGQYSTPPLFQKKLFGAGGAGFTPRGGRMPLPLLHQGVGSRGRGGGGFGGGPPGRGGRGGGGFNGRGGGGSPFRGGGVIGGRGMRGGRRGF